MHDAYQLNRIIEKMKTLEMKVRPFMPEPGKVIVDINGYQLTPQELIALDSENKITSSDIEDYAWHRQAQRDVSTGAKMAGDNA
jgi:hypothetical protein